MKAWENNLRQVVPYVAGEQPRESNIIKLNTNENPYPPSPKVFELATHTDASSFRKYPDSNATELVEGLAAYHNLNKSQVFTGVGSDDVLALAFLTFFNSHKPILFPDITYSFYPVWAQVYGISYETPKLNAQFELCVDDYKRENGGVVIANPNAPTSIALSLGAIEEIVKANQDVIVIIDEAYVDFGGETALPLLEKYENLVVIRTYSKSRSMAGMRFGYALAGPRLIQAMNDVKESINSYTMNQESIILGAASLKDDDYFKECIEKIIYTREKTAEELKDIGFQVLESKTNFLFVTHPDVLAEKIFNALREKKIYVRFFNKPRISNYLRITIGTEEEMECVIRAMQEIVKG